MLNDGCVALPHSNGPPPNSMTNGDTRQLKILKTIGLTLAINQADSYVLLLKKFVAQIQNIVMSNGKISLVIKRFQTLENLFKLRFATWKFLNV